SFERAFGKAQLASGFRLPTSGRVFVSVKDSDKPLVLGVARKLVSLGFSLVCTRGTSDYFEERGVASEIINKVTEGRPHVVDLIKSGEVKMVINTTVDRQAIQDSRSIRRSTYVHDIPYQTTIPGALSAVGAIASLQEDATPHIASLQQLYAQGAEAE
ncbi:MAG: carbamoyl phosphate synthase large subunit, partial [Myxococcota bacterium]|nr:carbamoyl phosphate synthase large subunit [Myxococcota bacterium]